MIGLLGKKLGMTHVYDEFGRRRAVTAIQAGPCTVIGVREPKQHRYHAIQVGFESVRESALTKPELGQCKKAGVAPFRYVREFRLDDGPRNSPAQAKSAVSASAKSDMPDSQAAVANGGWKTGQQLTVDLFEDYEIVDVSGISIGKGFQGGMKRWHWRGGGATHGSTSHRRPGSIGSTTTPGRVFRGHHLPGHMGADRVTVQHLRVVRRDLEHNLLLVEGSIPGADHELVMVTRSKKWPGLVKKPQAVQVVVEEEEEKGKKPKAKK